MLAVVNATFIGPLPFPHSNRLAQLFLMPPGQSDWASRNPQSPGTFLRFRQHLQNTELVEGVWSRERVLGGDTEPEVVISGAVSPGVFALFGGSTALGRTFTEAEDQAIAKVVVLSHELWQRRFGGDASLLGRIVLLDRDVATQPASMVVRTVRCGPWIRSSRSIHSPPGQHCEIDLAREQGVNGPIRRLHCDLHIDTGMLFLEDPISRGSQW